MREHCECMGARDCKGEVAARRHVYAFALHENMALSGADLSVWVKRC